MPMRRVGRYLMFEAFASGGMASIHFGRLSADAGFARLVVLKRLHPQFANDSEFVAMFTDEARVSARVQHPNVVSVHDVVKDGEELLLVMDYVHGEPLSKLIRAARDRGAKVPARIAAGIVAQALHGLHAAHEARGEGGKPLQIVHRDVSPQNILVGADGVARVVDFGVAKALGRSQHTAEGNMKGKVRYFAPEQLTNDVDRRTDVFAASVVLWETLRAERLFSGDTQWEIIQSVLSREIPNPAEEDPDVPVALGEALMTGLRRERAERHATARAMATAIEKAGVASSGEIAEWMEDLVGDDLEARREQIAALEGLEDVAPPPSLRAPRVGSTAPIVERASPKVEDAKSSVDVETPAPAQRSAELAASRPNRFPWAAVIGAIVGVGGVAFGLGIAMRRPEPPAVPVSAPTLTANETPVVSSAAPSSTHEAEAPSTPSVPPRGASAEPSKRRLPNPPVVQGSARPAASSTPPQQSCNGPEDCQRTEACTEDHVCVCFGTYCDGTCRDTVRDPNNCGSCGHLCKGDEYCSGACLKCTGPNLARCNGSCVDLRFNPNCGRCGRICASGTMCVEGECE
ncbi:MAG: protein kinase [Polyangiaceae bacterium]